MNQRQLTILAAIAIICLVAGVWMKLSGQSGWQNETRRIGGTILEELAINDVARIVVREANGEVTLARKDGAWRVEQRYGYPADYGTISQLVKRLANERVKQTIEVGPSNYARLGLLPPSEGSGKNTGVDVELQNEAGDPLARVRLGKKHDRVDGEVGPMGRNYPDGRYLLVLDENEGGEVILVSRVFDDASGAATDWLDDQFVELRKVVEASLERDGKTVWKLAKDEENSKLTLVGDVPEGKQVKTSAVSGTARALAYARFADVADPDLPPAKAGLDTSAVYHAVNEDGISCTLRIGDDNGNGEFYARVRLEYVGEEHDDEAAEDTKGDAAETEAADPEGADADDQQDNIAGKTRALDKRLDSWTFLLRKSTSDNLLRDRSDFLEDKEEKKDDTAGAATGDASAGNMPPPPPHMPTE